MKILRTIYLILFFGLYGCTQPHNDTSVEGQIPLTVWVHGTKLTPTIVWTSFFYRLLGMNSALAYDQKYHKRTIADLLCEMSPERYQLENFYFFGWNGRLCFIEREKASKDLYLALLKLMEDYEEIHHQKPTIRIITHSHGGNVVLNLPKVQDPESPIVIDELILLCCPVQEETKHYIEHGCFKKVYAFYSNTDMFQIIDPQGLYKKSSAKKTFSERRFNYHDKLRQSRIRINGRSLMHIDFLCTPFLRHLPALCDQIDHFYATVIPSQISYEKIIEIQTNKDNSTHFLKKMKPSS